MRLVAAKLMPRLLTVAQQENLVSQALFGRSNADEKCSDRSGWENCRSDPKEHVRVTQI